MKINVNQIPLSGVTLEEEIGSKELELETEEISFRQPVKVKVDITKITNAVSANLSLKASFYTGCSRCLQEVNIDLSKTLKLSFQVVNTNQVIDFNSDIRQEIILDYPMKILCKPDCLGLCPTCGKNLNVEGCKCSGKNK